MSGMNFEELSPQERLIAEQAIMNFRTLNIHRLFCVRTQCSSY